MIEFMLNIFILLIACACEDDENAIRISRIWYNS
jgi:hypothetical protein